MPGQTEVCALMAQLRPLSCEFRKIRVGSLADGGYVLPDDCTALRAVLSLGVGAEVSFDQHFADQGVPVYQYDPTIANAPTAHARFHFHRVAWGRADGDGVKSLESIVRTHDLQDSNDVLLKFDVEGNEWEAFSATPAHVLKHFRIIVCELHGLNAIHDLTVLQQIRRIVDLLTRYHTVVHLHANNCCGITLVEGVPVPAVVELTLLRNDRSRFTPSHEPIPGPLDFPNMDDRPDLVLRPFG